MGDMRISLTFIFYFLCIHTVWNFVSLDNETDLRGTGNTVNGIL